MKTKQLSNYLLLYFFIMFFCIEAMQSQTCQTNSNVTFKEKDFHSWTADPFDQKVFIENKGQFNEKTENKLKQILFGASSEGVDLYFTANGLIYKHDELVPMTETEKEALEKASPKNKEIEEGKNMMKTEPSYLTLEWVGSNPDVQILTEEPVSFYYTYGGAVKSDNTIRTNAYKKIIYKNLYSYIDVEYIFPEKKEGIKYSLIVHPGANLSVVKIRYENARDLVLNETGNLIISSTFGNFTDHIPSTFYRDNNSAVKSSFALNGNEVSFNISAYDHSRTLIIDPWTTNPVYAGYNAAYDVNYDLNGNVYVCGSYNPFKLAKLDNTGAIQWVFNATATMGFYSGAGLCYYGDFTVDEISGTSYLCEGVNFTTGAAIYKVNTSGLQTGTFSGNGDMQEIWRAEYNRCINKIVIAGGGFSAYQAAIIDTDLVTLTPVNVLSTTEVEHDMAMLAIDNNNDFCYMATAQSNGPLFTFENIIIKCPVSTLVPITFSVSDKHKIREVGSLTFVNNITSPTSAGNGINGMAVSPNWLYTYDGDSLKRWDKNTGAFISGVDIYPLSAVLGGFSGTAIQVSWSGLSADECDNIYVGMGTSIREYNTSLTWVNTFTLPDTVYDLKLGHNNKLYACGKGFVTQIDVPSNNATVTVTQTPADFCNICNGLATVSAVSCGGNPAGFSYSWLPGGQNTQIATGLCPGNYTVTLTTNCFISFTGTVTVTLAEAMTINPIAFNTGCDQDNGTANIEITGGIGPFSYFWNTVPVQTTQTAANLSSGTYTITVTDSGGCTQSGIVTIEKECFVYIPTAFTPNGNGNNDVFKIISIGIEQLQLNIFNRWGELIYQTNDKDKGWDGSYKNKQAPENIYIWKANYFLNGTAYHKVGTVALIR